MDHLIVMDDVSGIAHSSNTLADFLTVSRKCILKNVKDSMD